MKKTELIKFIEIVEEQFKDYQEEIIAGYKEYLQDSEDSYRTICVEAFGIAALGEWGKGLPNNELYKPLYNFINSYRSYMIERHNNIFKQK